MFFVGDSPSKLIFSLDADFLHLSRGRKTRSMPLRCQQWRVLSLLLGGRSIDPGTSDDAAGCPAELLGAEENGDNAGGGGKDADNAGRSPPPLPPPLPPVILTLRGPDALDRALSSRAVRRLSPNVIYVCAGVLRPRSSLAGGGVGGTRAGNQASTTPAVAPLRAGTVDALDALLSSLSSSSAVVDFLYLDSPCERADVERLRRKAGKEASLRVRHALFWPAAADVLLPPPCRRSPSPAFASSPPSLALPPVPASCVSLLGHSIFASMRPRASSVPEAVAFALCCLQASSDAGGPAPRFRSTTTTAAKARSAALAAVSHANTAAAASPGGGAGGGGTSGSKKPPVFIMKISQPAAGGGGGGAQQQRRTPPPPPPPQSPPSAVATAFPDSPQARARLGLPCFASEHAPALPSIDSIAMPVREVIEAVLASAKEAAAAAAKDSSSLTDRQVRTTHLASVTAAAASLPAAASLALARSLSSVCELGRCAPGAEVAVPVPRPFSSSSDSPYSAALEALVRGYRSLRVLSQPEVNRKSSKGGGEERGIDVSIATGSRHISLRRQGFLGEAIRAALCVAARECVVVSAFVFEAEAPAASDVGVTPARFGLSELLRAAAASAAAAAAGDEAAAAVALARCVVRTCDGFEGSLAVAGDSAFLRAAATAACCCAGAGARGGGGGGGAKGRESEPGSNTAAAAASPLLPPAACLLLLEFAVRQALVADALGCTQMRSLPRGGSAIPLVAPPPGSAAGSVEEFGKRKKDRKKDRKSEKGGGGGSGGGGGGGGGGGRAGKKVKRESPVEGDDGDDEGDNDDDGEEGDEENGGEEESDNDSDAEAAAAGAETAGGGGGGGGRGGEEDDDDDVADPFGRAKPVGLRPSGVLISTWGAAYFSFAAAAAAAAAAAGSDSASLSPSPSRIALASLAAVDGAAVRSFSAWHAALFRALGSKSAPVMPSGWQQPAWACAPKTPPPFGGGGEEERGGDDGDDDDDESDFERHDGAPASLLAAPVPSSASSSLDLCLNGVPLNAAVLEEAVRAAGGAEALLLPSLRRKKKSASEETKTGKKASEESSKQRFGSFECFFSFSFSQIFDFSFASSAYT